MSTQLIVVLLLVLAATAYLLRRAWRTWYGSGCAGCGCSKKNVAVAERANRRIPLEQITISRTRPGS